MTYSQLAELWTRYREKGLMILAFPSNNFRQEPGSNEDIKAFVSEHYPTCTFPLFQKIDVNGPHTHPVYEQLKAHVPGDVPHNFFKYLVGPDGVAVHRYHKKEEPLSFESDIEKMLSR